MQPMTIGMHLNHTHPTPILGDSSAGGTTGFPTSHILDITHQTGMHICKPVIRNHLPRREGPEVTIPGIRPYQMRDRPPTRQRRTRKHRNPPNIGQGCRIGVYGTSKGPGARFARLPALLVVAWATIRAHRGTCPSYGTRIWSFPWTRPRKPRDPEPCRGP